MIERIIDMLRDQSWGPGILFVLGLCLVTSDGAGFPWLNCVGLAVLAVTFWAQE